MGSQREKKGIEACRMLEHEDTEDTFRHPRGLAPPNFLSLGGGRAGTSMCVLDIAVRVLYNQMKALRTCGIMGTKSSEGHRGETYRENKIFPISEIPDSRSPCYTFPRSSFQHFSTFMDGGVDDECRDECKL